VLVGVADGSGDGVLVAEAVRLGPAIMVAVEVAVEVLVDVAVVVRVGDDAGVVLETGVCMSVTISLTVRARL